MWFQSANPLKAIRPCAQAASTWLVLTLVIGPLSIPESTNAASLTVAPIPGSAADGSVDAEIHAISPNGFAIVGSEDEGTGKIVPIVYLPSGGGLVRYELPFLPTYSCCEQAAALDVSNDEGGLHIAGWARFPSLDLASGEGKRAVRWALVDGTVPSIDAIGPVPANFFVGSQANAISADGIFVTGVSDVGGAGGAGSTFVHSDSDGYVDLDPTIQHGAGVSIRSTENFMPPGTYSVQLLGELGWLWDNSSFLFNPLANPGVLSALSGDGTLAVGTLGLVAAYWPLPSGSPITLGSLPGDGQSQALSASNDGSVIVGASIQPLPYEENAFYWSEATGLVDLYAALQSIGILPLNFDRLSRATDVTSDGLTVVGTGAYRFDLPVGEVVDWGFIADLSRDHDSPTSPRDAGITTQNLVLHETDILIGATSQGTSDCGAGGVEDLWWSVTSPGDGLLEVDTCGSHDRIGTDLGIDTVISLHDVATGNQIPGACNDDWGSAPEAPSCAASDLGAGRDSSLSHAVAYGDQLLIRVSRYNFTPSVIDQSKYFELNVRFVPEPAVFAGLAWAISLLVVFSRRRTIESE